jgi:hypothetical protein
MHAYAVSLHACAVYSPGVVVAPVEDVVDVLLNTPPPITPLGHKTPPLLPLPLPLPLLLLVVLLLR